MTRVFTSVFVLTCILHAGSVASARTFRTSHFSIDIATRDDPARLGAMLERAYRNVREHGLRLPPMINVVVHASSTRFAARSGTSRLHVAATIGRTVHLQPMAVIIRRDDLDRSLMHELVHVALYGAASRAPRWLLEGFAMHVAGQRYPVGASYSSGAELDRALSGAGTHNATRGAYAVAGRLTEELALEIGRDVLNAAVRDVVGGMRAEQVFAKRAGVEIEEWATARLGRSFPR